MLLAALIPGAAAASSAAPDPGPTGLQRVVENFFGGDNATTVQMLLLLTLLSLTPSLLMIMTGFTRIIIVLSFTRNALGTQQMPSNQVLVGLALFLTLFVMWPTFDAIRTEAYEPYVAEEITESEAIARAAAPLSRFMLAQTQRTDLEFFLNASEIEEGELASAEEIPFHVLAPAFITSEIKQAFMIGFAIYIPFIVIDMVVASVLMSMGMMMLPPSMISLPFKVLLFILVDGWQITIGALLRGFLG